MSNRDLSLALRLYADSARFVAGLTQAGGAVQRFGRGARSELDTIRRAAGTLQGQLAQLGLGLGAVANQAQSARMDKGLTQIGQTAGVSREEVAQLRAELFQMGRQTGQSVDDLQQGFSGLVAAGLSFGESRASIDAINKAMAISTVSSTELANALTVASTAFNFDLAVPGKALALLDKMTVAGGLGSAELNKLPDIFARVGVNAASAGMGFDKTLAFIEVLSKVEKQPERLATLADSTLRLFTNLKYAKAAAEATGVRFFDQKTGARRDPIAVLRDIKDQYEKLKTDKSQAIFLQKAFGEVDLDTLKGLKTLFGKDMLGFSGKFEAAIGNAGGEVDRRLPEAIANAVDQTGRLKNALREAADGFAQPINDALQSMIQWGLDKKENGGLGLTGTDLIVGGAAGAAGLFGAARYGGKAVSAVASRFGSTAAGVAEGKALQTAAGVTPVFVVNWPASMGGSVADTALAAAGGAGVAGGAAKVASRWKSLAVLAGGLPLSAWGGMGAAGLGTAAAGVGGAAVGGYAVGSAINSILNWGLSKSLGRDASLGTALYDLLHSESRVGGEIRVRVDQDGRVSSVSAVSSNPRVPISMTDVGWNMVSPQ